MLVQFPTSTDKMSSERAPAFLWFYVVLLDVISVVAVVVVVVVVIVDFVYDYLWCGEFFNSRFLFFFPYR